MSNVRRVAPLATAAAVAACISGAASGVAFHENPNVFVTKAGSGSGYVSSDPPGISCGTLCSAGFYTAGEFGYEPVTLSATADPGSTFAGWQGDCSGTGSCTLELADDAAVRVVTARFEGAALRHELSVTVVGNGHVSSEPAGIDCTASCSASFTNGSRVVLTAAARAGATFRSWGGACSGAVSVCGVPIDAAKSVTATFDAPPASAPNTSSGSPPTSGPPAPTTPANAPPAVVVPPTTTPDLRRPTARALSSSATRGRLAQLRYRISDDSGRSRATATVHRGARRLATVRGRFVDTRDDVLYRYLTWRVPRALRVGILRFCIRADDVAGNRSRASCARLRIR